MPAHAASRICNAGEAVILVAYMWLDGSMGAGDDDYIKVEGWHALPPKQCETNEESYRVAVAQLDGHGKWGFPDYTFDAPTFSDAWLIQNAASNPSCVAPPGNRFHYGPGPNSQPCPTGLVETNFPLLSQENGNNLFPPTASIKTTVFPKLYDLANPQAAGSPPEQNQAAANAAFLISGDLSGPSFTDSHGIETPGCKNSIGQNVLFFAEPHMFFVNKYKQLFRKTQELTSHEPAVNTFVEDGPVVDYDYEMLGMYPDSYRNFVLYQACILNYYGDQASRPEINPFDYTDDEKQADCSAIIHLRNNKKLSKKDLELTVGLLGIQDLEDPLKQPPTPKNVRRGEVIAQCYKTDGL